MTSTASEVQKALIARLDVVGLPDVTEITDTPKPQPSETDYPFIEINGGLTLSDHVSGSDGTEEWLDLHIWGRTGGQRQIKDIAGAILEALDGVLLEVSGCASCSVFVERITYPEGPDGLTRHGVVSLIFYCRKD